MSNTRRLGRGLEALLGPISREEAQAQGTLREVEVGAIDPNPYQPRREFAEPALQELADSIRASGLLQPIVVRAMPNGRHVLIAGERRWRAVQRLGWAKVPAVLKEVDDQAMLTLALIENLQRDDLSAIDTAIGYERLISEFNLAQADVARLVGRDRATVANTLRLLKLPPDVQALVQERKLTEGHARTLLSLTEPKQMSRMGITAAEEGWSVRELEARVRGEVPGKRKKLTRAAPSTTTGDARRVEDALRERLQTDVRITARRKGRGFMTISYYSNDDLARLLEIILGEPFSG